MFLDGVDPIDLHFIHNEIDKQQVFLRKSGVLASPWCDDL